MNISDLRPNAKYVFKQIAGLNSRYELISHIGADIQNFPAIYTRNPKKGIKYIGKRKYDTVNKYDFALELAGGRMFTGFNVSPTYPTMAYGDDKNPKGLNRNDAILIKLNGEIIEIYFFFNQKESAKQLWELWTTNNLCMTVKEIPKEKPADGQNV